MKKIAITEHEIICDNPDSVFRYFAWPTVCRLPNGSLGMVCSGLRRKHVDPFGKLVMCYSFDEGKTWTRPALIIDTPLDDRDGGIATFGNGRVIVTTFNESISEQRQRLERATDGDVALKREYLRLTEAYQNEIEEKYFGSLYRISDDGGFTFSPIKKSPVSTPHGPIALPSGGLLYVGIRNEDNYDGDLTRHNVYLYKLDENDDFAYVGMIENNSENQWWEPYAYALTDEHIIVQIRTHNDPAGLAAVFQCETFDGGKTFTEPCRINDHGIPPHIMRHSSGVLVCTYGFRVGEPLGIRALFSRDDGKTWSEEYILTDDNPHRDLGYPACVEIEGGKILTVYYQYIRDEKTSLESAVIKKCVWELPV